jgi:hypothetical protein
MYLGELIGLIPMKANQVAVPAVIGTMPSTMAVEWTLGSLNHIGPSSLAAEALEPPSRPNCSGRRHAVQKLNPRTHSASRLEPVHCTRQIKLFKNGTGAVSGVNSYARQCVLQGLIWFVPISDELRSMPVRAFHIGPSAIRQAFGEALERPPKSST